MRDIGSLTIRHAQITQPWRVPYSTALEVARRCGMPHLMGTHAVLHAVKTAGQIAAIFEGLDHSGDVELHPAQREILRGRTADLMTAALRLGNLYGFDVAAALVERSEEKNNVTLPAWPSVVHHTDDAWATRVDRPGEAL